MPPLPRGHVGLSGKRTLLWLGTRPAPANVCAAAGGEWNLRQARRDEPLGPQFSQATLVAVGTNGSVDDPRWLETILCELDRTPAVAVFLLPEDAAAAWSLLSRRVGHFLCVSKDAAADELSAKFAAAGDLQKGIENLRAELSASRGMGAHGPTAKDIDEEMRLASRLQRDFLPRKLPEVGPVRFAAMYRPAGWVSGDIYDVVRLDETHVGFYVADVVGHGMPAALLTMFIKRALPTKRIEGNSYQIVPPEEALAALNVDICEQGLSSCQFCTAAYCIVDTADRTATYARAGHPEPVVLRADGAVEVANTHGCLLGIFPEEEFHSTRLKLSPGDRVLVYSDGAEYGLFGHRRCDLEQIKTASACFAGRSEEDVFAEVSARIDADRAANGALDDVTIVLMEVE